MNFFIKTLELIFLKIQTQHIRWHEKCLAWLGLVLGLVCLGRAGRDTLGALS